jgi:hypothetical protein
MPETLRTLHEQSGRSSSRSGEGRVGDWQLNWVVSRYLVNGRLDCLLEKSTFSRGHFEQKFQRLDVAPRLG